MLHPSEICRDEWCQRAGYYQLIGQQPAEEPSRSSWRQEMVFDEGHEIHHKWQSRIWDLGKLQGTFYCLHCQYAWWAHSPAQCEKCGASREFLTYHEVPLRHGTYRIAGHADGQIPNALVEIKSVGLGTVLFENRPLLEKHTYKFNMSGRNREFIDLDALWDDIRRPFPSHIRQAHLYSLCSGYGRDRELIEEEVFIYECKWNQRCKEFVVRYRQERIQPILDSCRRIIDALESGKPPPCSHSGGCSECQRYEGESRVTETKNGRRFSENDRGSHPHRSFRRLSQR
jgi:hypothetical protein